MKTKLLTATLAAIALVAALTAAVLIPAAAKARTETPAAGDEAEYSGDTLIVTVEAGTPKAEMEALFERYGLEVVYDYENFSMYAVRLDHTATAEELDALIAQLEKEPHVLGVEKDSVVYATD